MPAPRNAVGVYDRPHPLRTRKALVAAAIALVMALACGVLLALR